MSRYLNPFARTLGAANHTDNEWALFLEVPTTGTQTRYPQAGDIVGQ